MTRIELVHDGDGIAVIGDPSLVESFIQDHELGSLAQDLPLGRVAALLDKGAEATQAAAEIASGRYVKLTKESARAIKEFGLIPTKTQGISHAMLGQPGRIRQWVQIETGVSLFTNPAVLTGVAGVMTQLARQLETQELKRLLITIDNKLDDVRRRQRDGVLAKVDQVVRMLDEAMEIRDHGGDPETTWNKIQSEAGLILEVQANALRELEALADKADATSKLPALKKAAQEIESELGVWLATLARSCQLQNEFAVLELDRVLATAPDSLDGHRSGLQKALCNRLTMITETTQHLQLRLKQVGVTARDNHLLHAHASPSIIRSTAAAIRMIDDFHAPLAIEADHRALAVPRWSDAVRQRDQWRNAAAQVGPKALTVGLAGAGALVLAGLASLASNDSDDEDSLECPDDDA